MKLRSLIKQPGPIVVFVISLSIFLVFTLFTNVGAASVTDFIPGNIIDDGVFYNKDSMTVGQIQKFLDRLIPDCDIWGTGKSEYGGGTRAQYAKTAWGVSPPFVCLNKYYENPENGDTSFEKGGGAFIAGVSAAQIIYNAAQTYNINPQVLLVMIKKESPGPLTADSWPLKSQYKYAMGYACPDGPSGAACNSNQSGFYKQIMLAAWQLNYYKQHPNDYRYRIGWNDIQYSTDASCGTRSVYVENVATLSLYIYTPYTPNDAALAAYPGQSTCGAYGNRNFYAYFKEWFGTTRFIQDPSRISLLPGDFDGNGSPEIGMFYAYSSNTAMLLSKGGLVSDTSEYFAPMVRWNSAPGNWESSRTKLVSGDFNGDGKTDVGALYDYGSARIAWWVFNGTTSGLAAPSRSS